MPTCFVIQPFSRRFDQRYNDVYKRALEEARLEPYRVDQDPSTEKIIETIEDQIRKATICLADITTDNPNVWYELGYAFAVGRSVIMVCSKERKGKYPFDIRHRTIIEYTLDSLDDFAKLRKQITTRAKALLKKIAEQPVIETQQLVPTQDLTPGEFSVLRIAAGKTTMPGTCVRAWSVRENAIRDGLNGLSYGVAIQSLKRKGFVELYYGEYENGEYDETVTVTDSAWTWLTGKEQEDREDDVQLTEDDIPF